MIDAELTPKFVASLDLLAMAELVDLYGRGERVTAYAAPIGYWRVGDGRPAVTFDDDPASAQAAGRCVAARARFGRIVEEAAGSIHPARCAWCDYPADVLLAALDHATYMSRFVTSEYVVWQARDGEYVRTTGRAGTYEHFAWRAFFEAPAHDRAAAVAQEAMA